MSWARQFREGALDAPLAVRTVKGKTWLWALVYLFVAGCLLMATARWIGTHKGALGQWVLDYALPESMHGAAQMLYELYLKNQSQLVLLNAIVTGALLLVSVTLFPLKEQLSKSFETTNRLTGEPICEHPLWYQGLEELKLVLLYLTAQMVIFKIGYGTETWRKPTSIFLSVGYLTCTVAIDFIAPTLQRHKMKYSAVIKTLLLHPVGSLSFGLVFATPTLLITWWGTKQPAEDFDFVLMVMFGVQVVAIVWAAIGGTRLGAYLLPACKKVPQSSPGTRLAAWSVVLAIFCWHTYIYGAIGLSAHHKSQLLKCDYSIHWSSISLERPSLSSLLGGEIKVGVKVDMDITNPTAFDVRLEDTHLEVRHEKDLLAQSEIDPIDVPAGETRMQTLRFEIKLDASQLLKGRELLEDKYNFTLIIDVAPGVEFPIYLRHKG